MRTRTSAFPATGSFHLLVDFLGKVRPGRHLPGIEVARTVYPVATALGTDLIMTPTHRELTTQPLSEKDANMNRVSSLGIVLVSLLMLVAVGAQTRRTTRPPAPKPTPVASPATQQ